MRLIQVREVEIEALVESCGERLQIAYTLLIEDGKMPLTHAVHHKGMKC